MTPLSIGEAGFLQASDLDRDRKPHPVNKLPLAYVPETAGNA
jgi:hypothetical protein